MNEPIVLDVDISEQYDMAVGANDGYEVSTDSKIVINKSAAIEPLTVTANGTYTAPSDVDGYSPVTVNVSGGGGGALNFVQGTFTGTTVGQILEINVPYTGSGYPIAAMIFPKEGGYNSSGTFYNAIKRYAIHTWAMVKNYPLSEPSYAGGKSNDKAFTVTKYKSSTSSPTTYSSGGAALTDIYANTSPNTSNNGGNACKFSSSTKMKVLIATTSYGFMAGIEYVYCVVYST